MNETAFDNQIETSAQTRIDGVVIGVLTGFDGEQHPLVVFPGNPSDTSLTARATTVLTKDDVGKEVALLFENGDPNAPMIIGRLRHTKETEVLLPSEAKIVDVDGERNVIEAKEEIVLKCGKASITLTKAGKIILRGAYVLSRSSGVNRIKGGSVQIN
ncbi:DUF6484 domain-containing protein [Methylomonas rapida]|uniref:DUF6484 domain-containing protein n=1 Tax=Methylomonas rapida TaxID=2963939 RepID=A0ABY7GFY4_9GAMM|nr:DUF6484 domain-containing protein [Methylomonas rapida]WAR44182.1 DUF6484 domain-containing protein [Methylomonas rapida]